MIINKKQILFTFLGNIRDISDKNYQKRVWIRGEGPECDSFDETCCQFFPIEEDILENYKQFNITEMQRDILKKFRDEFRVFSHDNNLPQVFIDTPELSLIHI